MNLVTLIGVSDPFVLNFTESYLVRIVAVLLLGAFVASSQTAPGTRNGNDRILNLNQRIRTQPDGAKLRALLEERARLLAELIEQDPRAAADSVLSGELLQDLARRVRMPPRFLRRLASGPAR